MPISVLFVLFFSGFFAFIDILHHRARRGAFWKPIIVLSSPAKAALDKRHSLEGGSSLQSAWKVLEVLGG